MVLTLRSDQCFLPTCYEVSKADGAEGDEAVVDGLGVGPALVLLEHEHGHDEEESCSRQERHQVDEEAGTRLQWAVEGRSEDSHFPYLSV